MKASEALARAVMAEDPHVFGLMGDGNVPIWGPLVAAGATLYSARHEAAAVAMADGYHRATGKVGITTITWGPGLSQIGTSLMAAARNRSNLVMLLPELPPGVKNKLQSMDQRRFVEACETRYLRLSTLDNLAEDIAEAFYLARTQSCPVALGVPIDLIEQELEWDFEYRPAATWAPAADGPGSDAVAMLADLLAATERPVFIGGRGARASDARAAIEKLAERCGALLATSLQAKGLFDGHPWDVGIAGSFASRPSEELFGQADLVVAFGAELGYYTSEGGLLFPEAQVVRVDLRQPPEIGVIPGRFVRGDAAKTADAVEAELARRGVQAQGFRSAATQAVMTMTLPPFDKPADGLDARVLMRELSAALPKGSRITCGAGHFFGFVGMYLALPEDSDIHFSLAFGAVGQTLPIAIGMAAATPGEPRIMIEGDGSLMFNLQELQTVARYRLPMTIIVLNDAAYGAEVHKLITQGYDPDLARWESPDFVALAKAFGGDGVRPGRESDLPAAVARGRAQGGLYLIDCRIAPSVMTDPYRKIHHGAENQAPLLRRPQA